MRVRRLSTPSPRSAASESVWGFAFALLAGSRRAGAAVAVIVASILMTGAPAAVAVEATGAPQTAGAPSTAPHVHGPPAAPDDLRAQQTPTPDDEIPDVALTLGGASHTVDVEGYFTDSVNGYEVRASPDDIVHTSRSGTEVTIEPIGAGSATVTVIGKKPGRDERKQFTVTVSAMVAAPTATGSIAAATITEGATHTVTASDYFEGEGVTYAAESSDPGVATVAVDGAVVTVTAVAAGSATVTVTATNAGGSAEQAFAVTVATPAPAAVGSIEAATLTAGATHVVTASDYFEGEGAMYTAESSDPAVATVAVDGTVATVTAVAAGSATVTVTATNAGGSAEQEFAVTVVPPAPANVGSVAAATITEGATHMVTASEYFEGEGLTYTAESSDPGVATVEVEGAVVTVTAVAVGSATVTVTATNAGGSVGQSFAVTVQLPPVTLILGGVAQAIELSEHFGDAVTGFDVSVSPVGVVQASISGSLLTLAPLGVGTATVTLEVTAGEVSALHQFPATVVPAAPTALGSIAALTLAERETHTVTASDYFAGEGVTYMAESSDTEVATVAVDGAVVTVTAIAAGEATVTVTATNEGGKAEQSFVVTVQLPAVTLTLGGAAREIELADYFGDEVTGYEVTASPSGIVHVSRSGSQLTLTAVAAGSATITVTATNAGGSAEQAFAVTVVPPAPLAVGSIAAATFTEGATRMVTASEYFEGEGLTYTAESSDPGVATVEVEGAVVTVTAVAVGSATVTVTATNAGGSVGQSFAVTVQLPPVTLILGGVAQAIELSEHFGDAVTGFDVSVSPVGVVQASISGSLLTLAPLGVGTATVTLEVTAGEVSALHQFPATVVPAPPSALGSIAALTLAGRETHTVTASDYFAGEGVTYLAESSDPGVATVAVDGAVVTVTAVAAGSATIKVTATNEGGKAEQSFVVTVQLPAIALTLGGAAREIELADYFGDEVTGYEATVSPSGIVHVSRSGSQLTLTAVAAGSATITVTATNAGGSAEQAFAVTVLPPAPATVGSVAAVTLTEGATHMVTASDYFVGEGITYAAESSDTEVATVAVDGAAVTVTAVTVGSATVTVTATNAVGSAEQSFAVTVVPLAPSEPTAVGSIAAATITEGATRAVTASDYFVGEGVTYTAESSDAEVATVAVEGATVTVTAVAAGSATITVTATNAGGSAEQSFAVTVLPPAPAAVGSIAAATLTEGATHMVTASDYFSGEGVTHTAESADPAVATVAVDGAVVTVTAVAVGSTTITVTATNAGGSAAQRFAVTVQLPPVTLTLGGAAQAIELSEHFGDAVAGLDVSVSPAGVVQASMSGSLLTLTPLAVGTATVTLEVTAGEVSALHLFPATVAPAAPTTLGSIAALTLAGRETHTVTASDYFVGEGVTYDAESSDPGVATVAVDGAAVTVTAIAAGEATVTVTATNESGKAEQSFVVTVQLPAIVLTLGGAAQEIELADYFGDEVTGYEATVSPSGIVHVSRSGSQLTLTAVAAGSATVTVTATNAVGSAEQSFAVTVVPLAPAAVGSIAAVTLTEGATHMVTASDHFSGEGITYTAETSDPEVATVAVSGATVVVTAVAAGSATITVTATNAVGSAEQSFAVTVVPPAPTAAGSIKAATLTEGATHMVTASDYFSGAGLAYAAQSSDAAVATVAVEGATVVVTAVAAGSATITVTATNEGGSAAQAFAVTVVPPAPAAVGSIEAATITEGDSRAVTASDYFAGEGLTYTAESSDPAVATVAVEGAVVSVTAIAAGSATVTVTATNEGGSAEQAFAVTVVPLAPPAPTAVGSIEAATITEGATHTVTASEYFAGAGVTYDAESSDPGVATVAVDGAAVTVTAIAAGEATVTVTATNEGGKAEQSFVVTIQLPAVTLTLGGAAQEIELADYFGDEVTGYEVTVSPSGIVHVSRSGSQLTLTAVGAGSATITVTATNAGGSAEQAFAVTVLPPAPATVGSVAAVTLTEGATHMVTASDYFVGEGITYAAESSDTEVATVAVSGATVVVTAVAVGSATVTVTATNAGGSAGQSFAVTVAPPAPAAVGSIAAATLTEGATHAVTASDYFSGEGVTYAAESSDTEVATVAVDGAVVTVTAVAVGSATVTVTATNAGGSAEQSFAVTVLPPAPAAVGSIEAATLTEGATHMVTASDYFAGERA